MKIARTRGGASVRRMIAPALAALAAAAVTGSAYWPGLMTWDPVSQYTQATSGDIDDWHPPAMQWLWRRLIAIHPGPAPMLLLQLALYWGGLTLLATALVRRGRPRTGWALLACGLLPLGLALTGAILKDNLMTGALLVASGLLAWRGGRGDGARRILAVACLVFAAMLRFNGFTAALPLLIALLPPEWWRGRVRLTASVMVATVVLMAAMPLANRAIGASHSDVELSLAIFDLGGITEHSGVSVFPPALGVADPVRVNHGCYKPNKWDSYSDWVDPECPLGFSAWEARVRTPGATGTRLWIAAIAAHPLAYAAHRLTHFAINTRLVPLSDAIERPVPIKDAPNPWGFHVAPGPLLHAIDGLAVASAHTPLGWPAVWIALALGVLIAGWRLADAALIVPLALSSLLYGCGYLVFSVAAELRYHLWTELAALLAAVLVAADIRSVPRGRLLLACVPVVATVAAALWMRR